MTDGEARLLADHLSTTKQRVYLVGGLPWGSEYLFARVWWCGDEWCDCTQAQIERVGPNRTTGPPWVTRETVWQGEFYSDGESGAEADLQQHLAELEAAGQIEVVHRADVPGRHVG